MILVACEESQAVTIALRKFGVVAYSCDIEESSGGHSEWHIQGDVLDILHNDVWDAVLAFPPCTHLAASGARWFPAKREDGRQQQAIDFFMEFTRLKCPWMIENPVGIMSTIYRKPDQIIQPWMFGHGEVKTTCLWLHNLPLLQPTLLVEGRRSRIMELGPSEQRAKVRSKTYQGIADAMAQQYLSVLRMPVID